MSKKTLLLTASYEVISFIQERKSIKLLYNDKVDIVSCWDEEINWTSGNIKLPSILRLKKHVRRNYFNYSFAREAMIKRDKSTCQFCGKKIFGKEITVDHVIPKAQGGGTSFANCVTACQDCNSKKSNQTPEQANMFLLKKPTHPSFAAQHYINDYQEFWHPDWDDFLGGGK